MDTTDSVRLRELVVRAAIPLLGEFDTLTTARIADAAGVGEADLLAVFADKDAVMQACLATISADMAVILDAGREMAALDAIRLDQPLTARLADALTVFDTYHRRVGAGIAAYEQAMTGGSPAPETADHRSPAEAAGERSSAADSRSERSRLAASGGERSSAAEAAGERSRAADSRSERSSAPDSQGERSRAADARGESEVFAGVGRGTVDAPRSAGRQDLRFLPDLPELQQAVVRLLQPDRQHLRLPVDVLAAAFLALGQAGTRIRKEVRSPLRPEHVVDLFLHGATTE